MEQLRDIVLEYVQLAEELKIKLVGDSLSERNKLDTFSIVSSLINLRLAMALEHTKTIEAKEEVKEEKKTAKK